ncbi:MAG: ATP cone domain-containing protein [Planctomycetota bacterium]
MAFDAPAFDERREAQRTPLGRVIKRDGREVPFDVRKIRSAIEAALEAAGEADPDFAREVASVVEMALEHRDAAAGPPEIEAIQDLVERALMELGRPSVAKAYILYRDRRARVREALRVHSDRPVAGSGSLRVREAEGVAPWSKGRIVAALMEEAELPRQLAGEVAAAVEKRVFASGFQRLTTGLIRELVTAELFERGQTHALGRARAVGLARRDVAAALDGRAPTPWHAVAPGAGADSIVGRAVLGRYALEELLPEGVAELHRSGDLGVEAPGTLDRPASLVFEAELFAQGTGGRAAFGLLDRIAEWMRSVSQVVCLERPGAVLAPLTRQARTGSPLGLGAWLQAASALTRAAGVELVLGSSGARFGGFTARLLEEWTELGPLSGLSIVLDGHELEELLVAQPELAAIVDRFLADDVLRVSWGDAGERYAGPGCRRMEREHAVLACGAAFTINLPRLARRAGPWREDLVLAGVAELCRASLEGARALEPLQRRVLGARGLRPRLSYALVPVGLREALLVLGDGDLDADQGARLLGLLGEASRRFAPEAASVVAPATSFGRTSAARFAALDQRQRDAEGVRQAPLFSDPDGTHEPKPYGLGLALRTAGTSPGRLEAEALRTLRSGALAFGALAQSEPGATPALDVWRRFEVLRRSHTGEVSLELFPRPGPRPGARTDDDASPLRPLSR